MGNAIQISRKSQSAYIYKGNNRGNNVTDEQNVLTQTGAKMKNRPFDPVIPFPALLLRSTEKGTAAL